ncbi:MAG TPA: sensor histidine kinase [Acetobacteraceae bacterium]|jgi:signal transduction histidine kinase|nr:sensor histidine kinase [Acetobacteraceae bacterium]
MRRLATIFRSEFLLVVLATALPVWLGSAVLLYNAEIDARALVERDAGATARSVMVAIDRDVAAATVLAETLATSQSLLEGDLARFYVRASNAIQRSGVGSNLVLSDASGQQVLNTLQQFGQPLPRHGNPNIVQTVFATAKPMISDLYIGGLMRRPVLSVEVPVIRDDKVIYDLSIGLFPERKSAILRQQRLPAGWIAGVIDSTGSIIARSQDESRFVGQKATQAFLQAIAQKPVGAGTTAGRTLEGVSVSTAWARSDVSGWTVAVAVPSAELTDRVWRFLALSVACTLALIVINLAMAAAIGRRLEARTIESTTARVGQQGVEEAARARSSYFAYLSHELRTPLMAVSGCAERIATRSQDAKVLDYCERIDRNTNHIIDIIEQIQSYARHEAGELKLHKTPLDVADKVQSSVDLLEGIARQAGVEVQCKIDERIPPLNADEVRLRQILINLLSNAIKFTSRGGTVTISAGQVGTDCVIRVADTGIGISANDLPRIVLPFAQVENAQTGKRRGTGLGLPLSKGLVEQHGGSLTLASVPGFGTTVTVRLPSLAVLDQQTAVEPESKASGPHAELAKVGS